MAARLGWTALLVLSWLASAVAPSGAARAHSFIVDQENSASVPGLFQSLTAFTPMGQEFTPALSGLDSVELYTTDQDATPGEPGVTMQVRIRDDTITGSILGTSLTVSLPNLFPGGVTHFDFPSTVSLVPGQRFVIEMVFVSGEMDWGIGSPIVLGPGGGSVSSYPGGRKILSGVPDSDSDFWFREGPVPEPSTGLLFAFGLVGLGVRRRLL